LADDQAERAWQALEERAPECSRLLKEAPEAFQTAARRVFACSDFVIDALARDERLLPALLQDSAQQLSGALPLGIPEAAADESAFMEELRRWRRAELARIAWRDLAGWASLPGTLRDLSDAADSAIRAAHEFAWRQLTERHGPPSGTDPESQRLIVIAMGKLGGRELNFS